MHELLTFIITLLVGGILLYLLQLVLGLWPLPAQVKTIILVVVALVILLWILGVTGIFNL